MNDRLYVDNAATSFPKPPEVLDAMRDYASRLGASAGRGAYREALETGRIVDECRTRLARLIGAEDPTRVVFTLNCSEALNLAIKGLLHDGDHVVTTTMEHNSVLRPLSALHETRGVGVTHVEADSVTGVVSADAVLDAVRPNTRLIVLQHASNVTGALQPVEAIGPQARSRGVALLVDAAQSAGHVPIDVRAAGIDLLAVPGHKGLLGPLGTGALYVRPGLEASLRPLVEGGTGTASELPVQPRTMPDKYESGSHNAVGLAGLAASLGWIESATVAGLQAHQSALCGRFLDAVRGIDGLTCYGPAQRDRRVAVFSVRIDGLDPQELSALLETEFGVLTRSGIHCAPWAHRTLGTLEAGGATRLSFGAFNTPEDVVRCTAALSQLAVAGVTSPGA